MVTLLALADPAPPVPVKPPPGPVDPNAAYYRYGVAATFVLGIALVISMAVKVKELQHH